jgi:hypothetical protein
MFDIDGGLIYEKYLLALESRAIGDTLYHKTELSYILDMLFENRINLTFSSGADEKYTKGKKFFYLSCARSMTSEYIYKYLNKDNFSSVLVLDGHKLSLNHQILPLDYWGPSFGKDEMEDRVLSDKPSIENAIDYIKEIRLYIPPDYNVFENEQMSSNIRNLRRFSKSVNIKIYDKLQNYILGKGSSIESRYYKDYNKDFRERLEWLSQDIPEELPYDYYEISEWSGFLTHIHNIKNDKNPENRKQLVLLQSLIKRNKVSGINELIKKKINDYKKNKNN